MIRLGALVLALLAVIGVALIALGSGGERAQRAAQTEEVRPTSQDPEASKLIEQIKTTIAPNDDVTEESDVPASAIVQAETQTPQRVEKFPGPPLRPSPEHEGRDSNADQASDLRANAQGPILYVTGNRVNFRSGPTTSDGVVGALSEGAPVEALGPTDGDWVHIRDADGREGYMSGQFLSAAQ